MTTTNKQQKHDKLKPIVDDILKYGDLLLVANKGVGKTNALMQLARAFRLQENTRVVIVETFPKWCNEFDELPFVFVNDSDVVTTDTFLELNEEDYFVRTSRDYVIRRGSEFTEALSQTDILFTLALEDTDRISFFIASLVYSFYRKNYLTAYKYGLDAIDQHVVFICEESQNLFDASIISKRTFNKLRKMFSETRNLKIHFVLATQRLVDINTKIRGRTRLMIGRVNVDDYDLKIRRILRHKKHKSDILSLPIDQFLYVPQDRIVPFDLFKQKGKPYLLSTKPETETKPSWFQRWIYNRELINNDREKQKTV